MDTHEYLLIRFAIFATMLVLWIAVVALAVYFGRRRSSPARMPVDAARGEAANAPADRSPLRKAA